MYKLIAIDLDGTLLSSDGSVAEQNKRALAAARDKGVHVVLATGRPPHGVDRIRALLDFPQDEYLILYNGALTKKISNGRVISRHTLVPADYRTVADFAESFGMDHYTFREDACLTTVLHPVAQWENEINGIPLEVIDLDQLDPALPLMKVNLAAEPAMVDHALANVPEVLASRYCIVRSAPNLMEFLDPRASKGQALQDLAASLGIRRDEIVAIGDSGNDLDMISFAGLGAAMGNASEDVKAAADYVTSANDLGGVAEVIRRFILDN